jgi:hypothetical protein
VPGAEGWLLQHAGWMPAAKTHTTMIAP